MAEKKETGMDKLPVQPVRNPSARPAWLSLGTVATELYLCAIATSCTHLKWNAVI